MTNYHNSSKLIKYKKYHQIILYLKIIKDFLLINKKECRKAINKSKWHFDLASSSLKNQKSFRISKWNKNVKNKIIKEDNQTNEDIYPLI